MGKGSIILDGSELQNEYLERLGGPPKLLNVQVTFTHSSQHVVIPVKNLSMHMYSSLQLSSLYKKQEFLQLLLMAIITRQPSTLPVSAFPTLENYKPAQYDPRPKIPLSLPSH